jgi:sec-independent protein translocase protein TatC
MISPTPADEAAIDATKAPLLDHLIELRKRIIYSLIALFAAFILCYAFAQPIYRFLSEPLANAMGNQPGRHLIYTGVAETFFTYVKVGFFGGLCLAFPIIASQLWMFIAPGLYRHERNAFLPFLVATPVLFILGAAFVYYVMLPFALKFFLSFETAGGHGTLPIQLDARVSEYLDFVMTLIFAFGLCFQLPVLLGLLGRVGIINSRQLRSVRRYAILGIVVLAAVVTPPDPFSMMSLVVPLVLLYEVSILVVRLLERDRDRKKAQAATG